MSNINAVPFGDKKRIGKIEVCRHIYRQTDIPTAIFPIIRQLQSSSLKGIWNFKVSTNRPTQGFSIPKFSWNYGLYPCVSVCNPKGYIDPVVFRQYYIRMQKYHWILNFSEVNLYFCHCKSDFNENAILKILEHVLTIVLYWSPIL